MASSGSLADRLSGPTPGGRVGRAKTNASLRSKPYVRIRKVKWTTRMLIPLAHVCVTTNNRGPARAHSIMAKTTAEATLRQNGFMTSSLLTMESKEVNLVQDSVEASVDKSPVVVAPVARGQLPDW